jgi:hypothetical protein
VYPALVGRWLAQAHNGGHHHKNHLQPDGLNPNVLAFATSATFDERVTWHNDVFIVTYIT